MGIGSAEDFVATKLRSDNLADNVSVGESNDKTIFGRVVFVLGLSNEALASVVVSLACSSALVLGLEAAAETGSAAARGQVSRDVPEVRAVLDKLSERHG